MLRFIGSLSPGAVSSLRKAITTTPLGLQKRFFCSASSETAAEVSTPVVLFQTPSSVVGLYRLIGISVYSQVLASLFYVEQMLFPSTPSSYSWAAQAAFASGLLGMSGSIPMVYFFAIRRNIFQVSILKNEREIILKHLGRSLQLVETKVKLDDIEPIARLSKNLRMLVHQRKTSTLDTFYLERRGKYLDRNLLEEIAKGVHTRSGFTPSSASVGTNSTVQAPAPGKYAIRPKKIVKDVSPSTDATTPPTSA